MSDPTQQCPTNWTLNTTPVRTCIRHDPNVATCDSAFYPSYGRMYQQICGRIIGYQTGDTHAFARALQGRTLEDQYLSGVSLTHGPAGSRRHIWSFAMPMTAADSQGMGSCPCIDPNITWPFSLFIGDDFFCDTGNYESTRPNFRFYNNPLWDGEGCMGNSACCEVKNPPWFCKTLPQSTTDDLEVRLCNSQPQSGENVHVSLIELYVQ